jgi:uncharacterized protein YndB with AHSA1/START domain
MDVEQPAVQPPVTSVKVTHCFSVAPERVFDAWLDPDLVRQWFAPGLGEMVRVDVDPQVGGKFSFVQRRGEDDVDHVGTYLELDRPRRLAFTWSVPQDSDDTSRVVIDIAPLETGSELTLTHELHPDWADYAERTEEAWSKMLQAMDEALGSTFALPE